MIIIRFPVLRQKKMNTNEFVMLSHGSVADSNNDNCVHDDKYNIKLGLGSNTVKLRQELPCLIWLHGLQGLNSFSPNLSQMGRVIKDRGKAVSYRWHVHKTCMQQKERGIYGEPSCGRHMRARRGFFSNCIL